MGRDHLQPPELLASERFGDTRGITAVARAAGLPSMRICVAQKMPAVGRLLRRVFADTKPCTQSLLGVQALARPGLGVEIEATARVDAARANAG